MGLYKKYVEWASEKLARNVIAPILNSDKTWEVCDKIVEINDKIAEKTGYDYLDRCQKEAEYARKHPQQAALKRIAKGTLTTLILGGITDSRNLNK